MQQAAAQAAAAPKVLSANKAGKVPIQQWKSLSAIDANGASKKMKKKDKKRLKRLQREEAAAAAGIKLEAMPYGIAPHLHTCLEYLFDILMGSGASRCQLIPIEIPLTFPLPSQLQCLLAQQSLQSLLSQTTSDRK